ncbi:MAG TPA: RNA polymerase sigma-70 factor [Flavitalea sp.]|nr:RNA polymerase sigma-70 factor [Flavitalea sp.]HTF28147.1 RNA polymerase sigma-70 factor [Flavitalea sp.]
MISVEMPVDKTREFEDLFQTYWEPLYAYAYRILEDHDDAQDIIQDLFLKLWKKRDHIAIASSIESYLFTSVKHGIYSHIRSNSRRNTHYMQIARDVEQVIEYEKYLEKEEVRNFLRQSVDRLPEKMKQIVKLYLHDCLNVREIAQTLCLSEQTVRNQLGNAVRKLIKDMNRQEEVYTYSNLALILILCNC